LEESSRKNSKIEAPAGSNMMKKKSAFTPPDLDINVTIGSIKTNNNVITDVNKIKDNESILDEKKSKKSKNVVLFIIYLNFNLS